MKRVSESTGTTFTRFTKSNQTEKSFSRMVNGEIEEIKILDGIPAGESHFQSQPDGPAWRQGALEDHSFKREIRAKLERESERRRIKAEKIQALLQSENSKRKAIAKAEAEAIAKAEAQQAAVVDSRPDPYSEARVEKILRNRDKRKALKAKGITGIRKGGVTTRLVKAKGIGASKAQYNEACKNAAAKVEFEGRQPSDNLMPAKGRVWAIERNGNLIKDHQNPKARDLPVRPQHLS